MKAAFALVAAAFVFYFAIWHDAQVIEGDSVQYMAVARDLLDLRLDELHDRAPGYPLLLSLTGAADHPSLTLLGVSLALHFASVLMLALLLARLGLSHRLVLIFCVVLLLPPFVEPAAHVMTETLAQFMLVSGATCLALWTMNSRSSFLIAAALAFGFAGLTRPTYQGLAPVLAVLLLVQARDADRRRFVSGGLALIAGAVIVLGPFVLTNYSRFGYPGVVPTAGIHLSTKTAGFVERLPDEYAQTREILIRARDAELVKRGGPHTGTQAIWVARDEIAAATGLSKPELSRYLLRMNLTLIRRAPLEYLTEVARSIATYWLPATGPLAGLGSSVLRTLWAVLHVVVLVTWIVPLLVLAAVGLFAATLRRQDPARAAVRWLRITPDQSLTFGIVVTIVLYTMVLSCFLDIGEARQRQSTDVLIVFLSFLGCAIWAESVRRRGDGRSAV